MRFSVDAHAIGCHLTGNEVYIRNLLHEFARLDSYDDFTAYIAKPDAPRYIPSRIATRQRDVTRPQARALHDRHPEAAGLRWWSTFESLWANVTLFDRAASVLRLSAVKALDLADEEILSAADVLGLRLG